MYCYRWTWLEAQTDCYFLRFFLFLFTFVAYLEEISIRSVCLANFLFFCCSILRGSKFLYPGCHLNAYVLWGRKRIQTNYTSIMLCLVDPFSTLQLRNFSFFVDKKKKKKKYHLRYVWFSELTFSVFLSIWLTVVDLILIMSVNPGFGGQSFIESQVKKISDLRKLCAEKVVYIALCALLPVKLEQFSF